MKAVAIWVVVTAGTVLLAVVALAAQKEYEYWAPRVGAVLLNLASYAIPKPTREARRSEWLAELDLLAREGYRVLSRGQRLPIQPGDRPG